MGPGRGSPSSHILRPLHCTPMPRAPQRGALQPRRSLPTRGFPARPDGRVQKEPQAPPGPPPCFIMPCSQRACVPEEEVSTSAGSPDIKGLRAVAFLQGDLERVTPPS